MDDQIVRYEQDGSVTLITGDAEQSIPAGWTNVELDGAASAFFADQG